MNTGKGNVCDNQNQNHSTLIVTKLMKDYLDKEYELYVDNYYLNVSLAEYPINRKTYDMNAKGK